ncbi:MAG TPA: uroporphyrinogen decarboxylase family protein [Longimicrobiales bacterium]
MTARERMAAAMRHERPDRVPVMCQLAIGHYFLQSGFAPADIWHDSAVFADALLRMQERYSFDGILINLPGREPHWRSLHPAVAVPPDDLPITTAVRPAFADVIPEDLYYVEPYDLPGLAIVRSFPAWQIAALDHLRERAPDVSLHSEVFSPFTQLLELFGYAEALMALLDDPARAKACLHALCRGTTDLMMLHAARGADAILISSAFAGAGFISRDHYREFVLPFEQAVITCFRNLFREVPVYTHTCGAIGDRLDLMAATGTNGIDTLDPPPLGTADLGEAIRSLGGRLFLKGNIDPVNTMLNGTPDDVYQAATERLEIARDTYGYILSTSCSVAPGTRPENIMQLARAAEASGRYHE